VVVVGWVVAGGGVIGVGDGGWGVLTAGTTISRTILETCTQWWHLTRPVLFFICYYVVLRFIEFLPLLYDQALKRLPRERDERNITAAKGSHLG
jgi:hypothetical protein